MIKFEIPGEPKGKGRPRLGKGYVYTPKETVNYENWVKTCFLNQGKIADSEDMLKGQIMAEIVAYFPIPKSISKKNRLGMLSGEILHTKKSDADNIAKIILDSLNGIAYKDDSQISILYVKKMYSDTPKVEVTLKEID